MLCSTARCYVLQLSIVVLHRRLVPRCTPTFACYTMYQYCTVVDSSATMLFFEQFTFGLWHEPSVCRLSVTLQPRHRLELFGNIFALSDSSGTRTVCITILDTNSKGSRGSCKLNTREYEKLAFSDQYLALFRKRYKIRLQLQWKTNRISYAVCRMVPFPVTLSDL